MQIQIKVYLLFLLFFSIRSFAGSRIDSDNDFPEIKSEKSFEENFLETNEAISKWFVDVADDIDIFLMGERITAKPNQTKLKIEDSLIFKDYEKMKNQPSISINLRLPNTEEYWNLKFTSYDENKERRATDKGAINKSRRTKDYGASLGFFQKMGKVKASFQPRVSFSNSLKLSHTLAFESLIDQRTFQINPKLSFYGNNDNGTGVVIALNYFIPLNRIWSLTFVNDGDYVSRSHLFSTTHGLSFHQYLSMIKSMRYEIMFDSKNQPNYHLDTYTFSLTWSHLIYKNILDYQVTPFLEFASLRNFRGALGAVFTVGLSF